MENRLLVRRKFRHKTGPTAVREGGGVDVGKQYRISAWHNFVFCCRSVRSARSAGAVAAPLIATPLTLTERFSGISTDRRLCQAAEGVVGFEVMTTV